MRVISERSPSPSLTEKSAVEGNRICLVEVDDACFSSTFLRPSHREHHAYVR